MFGQIMLVETNQIRHLLAFDVNETQRLAAPYRKSRILSGRDDPFFHDRARYRMTPHHLVVCHSQTSPCTTASTSLLLNSKKISSVVANNLLSDVGRNVLHLIFNDLLRVRPSARRVRVVGTKHHLVCIEYAAHHLHAERIVNEADPDLAMKVFARKHLGQGYRLIAG